VTEVKFLARVSSFHQAFKPLWLPSLPKFWGKDFPQHCQS